MEILTNPDLESLKLVLWCALGVICVLLVISGYLLKYQFKRQIEASDAIVVAVNKLKEVVNILKTQNEMQFPDIYKRLDSHSADIKSLDQRVIKIETCLERKSSSRRNIKKTIKP
jgi:hypothetical protein